MKWKTIIYLLALMLLHILISCRDKSTIDNQPFYQNLFDEEPACISAVDSTRYIVGSETGDIFIMEGNRVTKHFASDRARIYDMYVEGNNMWIGLRNNGVMKCTQTDSLSFNLEDMCPTENFSIPKTQDRYSPYNIIPFNDSLLLTATSNGLYYLNKNKEAGELTPIHFGSITPGRPFCFCSPIVTNSTIYLASDSGVVEIQKITSIPSISTPSILNGKKIVWIDVNESNGQLTALSKDSLFIIDVKDKRLEYKHSLPFSGILSFVRIGASFYFLSPSSLYVVRDLKSWDYSEVKLPYRVSHDCRNVMIFDKKSQMLRMATEKGIISFPVINGFGISDPNISHACYDETTGTLFFVNTDNELYEMQKDGENADKILQLPENENISHLFANNGAIYYIADNRDLKTISTGSVKNFFRTLLGSHPDKICMFDEDVTSMFLDKDTIYVGTRNSLFIVNTDGKKTHLYEKKNPYTTNITKQNGKVYATTLNDGLFDLSDTSSSLDSIHFQEDYSKFKNYSLLLSNHYINVILQNDSIIGTYKIKGYKKILKANGSRTDYIFAISKNSVKQFALVVDGTTLKTLRQTGEYNSSLNPDACIITGNNIYLSTSEGVMKVNVNNNDDALTNRIPVEFSRSHFNLQKTVFLIILALIILSALTGFFLYALKIHSKAQETVKEEQRKAKESIKEAEETKEKESLIRKNLNLLEEIKECIDYQTLKKEIESVDNYISVKVQNELLNDFIKSKKHYSYINNLFDFFSSDLSLDTRKNTDIQKESVASVAELQKLNEKTIKRIDELSSVLLKNKNKIHNLLNKHFIQLKRTVIISTTYKYDHDNIIIDLLRQFKDKDDFTQIIQNYKFELDLDKLYDERIKKLSKGRKIIINEINNRILQLETSTNNEDNNSYLYISKARDIICIIQTFIKKTIIDFIISLMESQDNPVENIDGKEYATVEKFQDLLQLTLLDFFKNSKYISSEDQELLRAFNKQTIYIAKDKKEHVTYIFMILMVFMAKEKIIKASEVKRILGEKYSKSIRNNYKITVSLISGNKSLKKQTEKRKKEIIIAYQIHTLC